MVRFPIFKLYGRGVPGVFERFSRLLETEALQPVCHITTIAKTGIAVNFWLYIH